MNIGAKIKQQRINMGLTLKEVGERVGVTEATVQRWESGNIQNMRRDKIAKLSEVLNFSPNIIIGVDDTPAFDPAAYGLMPPPPTYKVPRLGKIACGTPIAAEENLDGYDDAPENIKCDFTLVCQGDSMRDAGIKDGDIVYIRQIPVEDNGKIVAVSVDGETTLKYLYKYDDMITLRPANTEYREKVLRGNELESVMVIGVAVGFMRRI